MIDLGDYLDMMIFSMYVSAQRGIGYVEKDPSHFDIVEFIEDDKTGRPVPIDDSADHFLLRQFDRVRQYLKSLPMPKANGNNGSVYSGGRKILEINKWSGEIPWRLKHVEKCNTCKNSMDAPSLVCSAGHLDIRTRMTADQPGVVREISRELPLCTPDEQCEECGHEEHLHGIDDDGWHYCENCNCGNNAR